MKHTVSFKHAWDGVVWAFKTQPNFRVHTFIALIVIFTGLYCSISMFEWLIVIFTIMMGLVIEMINTAIESTNDAITRDIKPEIKIAKDVSAAAMLIYACGASIVGLLIFLPKLI